LLLFSQFKTVLISPFGELMTAERCWAWPFIEKIIPATVKTANRSFVRLFIITSFILLREYHFKNGVKVIAFCRFLYHVFFLNRCLITAIFMGKDYLQICNLQQSGSKRFCQFLRIFFVGVGFL